jgi:hypothetical protein
LLAKYLDPIPEFELFHLSTSKGETFVLFVFPRQSTRRILVRATVHDQQKHEPKILLREGDLWTKGSSTGKRLATKEDWDEIYQERVETEVEDRARKRTEHALQLAMAGERIRAGTGSLAVPIQIDDPDFQLLMEDIYARQDKSRLGVLLERFRDDLVESWHEIGVYENQVDFLRDPAGNFSRIKTQSTDQIKNVFRPAISRLTLAGMYAIKYSAPIEMFSSVVSLLQETFEISDRLTMLRLQTAHGSISQTAEEHSSHTVPALESLASLHLIGAYIAKRSRWQYIKTVLAPSVRQAGGQDRVPGMRNLMAFWPLYICWGEPKELHRMGGRIEFCAKKVAMSQELRKLLGSESAAKEWLCRYEFLLELNSHLAFSAEHPETEATSKQIKMQYPSISMVFRPDFLAYQLDVILNVATVLLEEIIEQKPSALKQVLMNEGLANLLIQSNGEEILAKFLINLRKEQSTFFLQDRRMPPLNDWPAELNEILKKYIPKRFVSR